MRYDFKVLIQMLVQMFYFDSNTTVFWKAYVDRMTSG